MAGNNPQKPIESSPPGKRLPTVGMPKQRKLFPTGRSKLQDIETTAEKRKWCVFIAD